MQFLVISGTAWDVGDSDDGELVPCVLLENAGSLHSKLVFDFPYILF